MSETPLSDAAVELLAANSGLWTVARKMREHEALMADCFSVLREVAVLLSEGRTERAVARAREAATMMGVDLTTH